ncbi:MAG: hypothetical protein LBU98_03440, partial [Alistipes sp.]|nr:hypothetical protein [Alistipes sp.]
QFDIEIKAEDEDSEVASATQTLKLKFVDDVTVWGTIAGDGFDIAEEQVVKRSQIAEAPQMKINITSLDGIENFLVDINGATIDGALQAVGLAGEFDLANPDEALATSLAGLAAMDIVLPSGDAIKGKKELAFDLTSFIPMIAALGEGSVSFKITVKDAAGHAVSETLTVTIDDDLTLSIASDAIGEEPLEILKSVATGETPTPVVVDIVADQGIANLTVKIESSSDYFMAIFGEATGIPAEFDLANAPEALAEKLAEIGLIDPENPVKDATEVQFDITDFIPMIFTAMAGDPDADPALPAEEECTADFTVTVKDGANQTKTATVALSLKDDSTEE